MCRVIKKVIDALFKRRAINKGKNKYKEQLDKVLDYLRLNKCVNIREFCVNDPFLKDDVDDIIKELEEDAKFICKVKYCSECKVKDCPGYYSLARGGKLFEGYVFNYIIKINKEFFKFILSAFIAIGALSSIISVFCKKKEIILKSNEVIFVADSSFVSDLNYKKNKSVKFQEKKIIKSSGIVGAKVKHTY